MLVRSADLRVLSVKTADGRRHAVLDLLTERDGIALSRVLVDFSGWIERHRAALPMGRFAEPNLEAGTWAVNLREEDLAAREGAGSAHAGRSIADWLGARVFDPEGEIGSVLDLVFATDDWHPDCLVVQIGGALAEDQRVIPMRAMASADWPAGEVRLAIPAEKVRQSPSFHEADAIRGDWVQNVLAYYGFGADTTSAGSTRPGTS